MPYNFHNIAHFGHTQHRHKVSCGCRLIAQKLYELAPFGEYSALEIQSLSMLNTLFLSLVDTWCCICFVHIPIHLFSLWPDTPIPNNRQ